MNIDYHVELEGHYYSAPYQLVGKEVEIHYTARHGGNPLSGQARGQPCTQQKAHAHSTRPEHRPKSHQQYLEWTPTRMIEWAGKSRTLHRLAWWRPCWRRSRIRRWDIAPRWASSA